ncbi:regulatory protein RecX [Acinetobacter qingfengensis]|uniref:Regulatory protein RecX n=2 Tax=Acinetobacter qingfengensis TaxID=1262585 RepID=A0A1E7RE49_9GAMM|nr:regulatory protein RecX [Acinetobacter qingfengensis]KAA8734380.1 regulatory protein RecX [Acinetobacter qingfengensis]OEY97611.1 hypothetical protein BJI46_09020 [Acinetobacter qingfengensis]
MTSHSQSTPSQPAYRGQKLRAFAFALLAKREYSKTELYQKLMLYAADADEVKLLLEELSQANYQSDTRMAGMLVRQEIRQGRGPRRIQQRLQKHQIDHDLAQPDLAEIDWFEQALQLKIKKFGENIAQDQKQLAKQIRFLQYRGYAIDIIMKVVKYKEND